MPFLGRMPGDFGWTSNRVGQAAVNFRKPWVASRASPVSSLPDAGPKNQGPTRDQDC